MRPDLRLTLLLLVDSLGGTGVVDASWTSGRRRSAGPSWTTEGDIEELAGAGRRQLRQQGTPIAESLLQTPPGLEESRRNGAGFEPYANNGGTVVAVAGPDYCIIAADSRLSDGYTILSRNVTRVHRLSGDTHLATAGCWADTQGLLRLLEYLIRDYEMEQRRTMGTKAVSRMLSTHLYYRRGFPFYTFNIVGGLDEEGIGAVYGYDAVGSFERVRVACAGGGLSLMQPVLDRLDAAEAVTGAGGGGRAGREQPVVAVGLEEALALVRRAFVAGGERDISLGDEVEIVVVTRQGHRRERLQLKSH
ncbi:unnamed protein product [Ectocarpus sp. 6 AP-2014]